MKPGFGSLLLAACFLVVAPSTQAQNSGNITVWLTTQDRASLLQQQQSPLHFTAPAESSAVIQVNPEQKFQTIDGFGFALTGGSAQLLQQMSGPARSALLQQIFSTKGDGIGVSYLRLSIGSSDMNQQAYSYDDLPAGQTDPKLKHFSFAADEIAVIPVLKQILAINPEIKILGSPWSAPPWMKTSDAAKGGTLKPEYYQAYAHYFVKYIRGMQAHGIHIDAVTVQNEPLNPKNTPSMVMFAQQEDDFIKTALGPAFQKAGLTTKILIYDHNPDVVTYALSILGDPAASRYVAGSAWHLYGGNISALTRVHDAFPDKEIDFTEQSITERPGSSSIGIAEAVSSVPVGATRNWARNVLLWNLAADPHAGPHTNDGGCPFCYGAITLDGDKSTLNIAYYTVAHFSKFVPPGSVRIASTDMEQMENVAFLTPNHRIVFVIANTSNFPKTFSVRYHGRSFTATLHDGSAATYVWQAD
jgi:glucosylceramidase